MHAVVLSDEEKHRYEFARHSFQMFVTWFTFFCILNITVLGWIGKDALEDKELTFRWIALLAGMMIAQNLLAVTACWHVREEFERVNRRLQELTTVEANAMPAHFYNVVALLVAAACVTYLVAWTTLIALSWN